MPESATPMACMQTRTAPSESRTTASSVDSQPRLPALVTRDSSASRQWEALGQALGVAARS